MNKKMRMGATGLLALALSYVLPASALPPGNNLNQASEREITVACYEASASDNGGPTADEIAGWVTFKGETRLWPPNHKYRDSLITAVDEDNFHGDENFDGASDVSNTSGDSTRSDSMTLAVTATDSNTLKGFTNGSGDPSKDNVMVPDGDAEPDTGGTDGDGASDVIVSVQAERSGRDQAGRIYNIEVTATFTDTPDNDDSSDDTTKCPVVFHICVPHDMRKATRADECPNPADNSFVTGTVT